MVAKKSAWRSAWKSSERSTQKYIFVAVLGWIFGVYPMLHKGTFIIFHMKFRKLMPMLPNYL